MKKEAEEWDGLFDWSISVRSAMGQNNISNNRIEALNQIEFEWDTKHYKYNASTGSIKSVELTDGTNTFTLIMKTS